MKIAILDDYQRATPALECFAKLATHDVEVLSEPLRDPTQLAAFEALVLIRERTRITASFLDALTNLKLIVQTAKVGPHVDLAARRSAARSAERHRHAAPGLRQTRQLRALLR